MIEVLNAQIDLLITRTKTQIPGYHIFFRLLKSIAPEIEFEQKLRLEWVFATTEKALADARSGNKNSCRFYLEEVDRFREKGNPFIEDVQNFVILPAKAFYEYHSLKDYGRAMSLMQDAIASIIRISKAGRPKMLLAAIEQYINVSRIVFKEDKEKGFAELGALLYFLFTDQSFMEYSELGKQCSVTGISTQERELMIDHITNVALEKVNAQAHSLHQLYLESIYRFFLTHAAEDDIPLFALYRTAVSFIVTGQQDSMEQLDDLILTLSEIYLLPKMLQYYFLEKIKVLSLLRYGPDPGLEQTLNSYYKEKLMLAHLLFDSRAGNYTLVSPLRENKKEEEPEPEFA